MTALVAVVALLLAAPFERGRSCSVCPVDCPMHAARKASARLGCHHGGASAETAHSSEHGACAMRASCGHRDGALPAFVAELPPPIVVTTFVRARLVPMPERIVVVADAPAPPDRPPEHPVV